eukprot:Anaeramoba_ignava/a221704_10.p1 GENE.a221704_10~~a221704_10.p1  ORF type:complete len:191 (-),score=68.50 a221704_10:25-597(-)
MDPFVKIATTGAGGVGKSTFTIQFCYSKFIEEYDPTIEDSYRKQIEFQNEKFNVEIYDTTSMEEEHTIFTPEYKMGLCGGFIIMYSITNRESFEFINYLLEKMIKAKNPDPFPVIIVGNKTDLESERKVPKKEAEAFCKEKKIPFVELTCRDFQQVKSVVVQICKLMKNWDHYIETEKRKKKKKGKENGT